MNAQEIIAEAKIQEALQEGMDRKLPGLGQPVDLSAWFDTPPHLRMAFSLLKSADVVPEELELIKTINRLQESLPSLLPDQQARIRLKISELHAVYDMKMQHYRKNA